MYPTRATSCQRQQYPGYQYWELLKQINKIVIRLEVILFSRFNYADGYSDDSLVLQVRYQDFSILLTGDISKESMEDILKKNNLQPSTVVKVPHHGSKGSLLPKFYEAIKPRYAVTSVGSNNIFGHPNPGVIDMLRKQNIKVLRTDQDGAVIIMSDGRRLKVNRTTHTVLQDS